MGYEDSEQLDDLIRIATRLRGRVREKREQVQALEKELSRLEELISVKVEALKKTGALCDDLP
jgi:predicted nuclease with TOPRIM domain